MKAYRWVHGRKGLWESLEKNLDPAEKKIWVHCSSLGEFEQGRPVLEKIKAHYPHQKIVLTFFSPSGFDVRKNTPLANYVLYLPLDTHKNAKKFFHYVNPCLAIFIKYEYWYHHFFQLWQERIPLYIISAIFRKEQVFFHWYGKLHRQMLHWTTQIFVQDQESKRLLDTIGITQVSISGDTRFDRVAEHAKQVKPIPQIQNFCKNANVFIAGSTWPPDEALIANLADAYPEWKFIIAPHEVDPHKIEALTRLFKNVVLLSQLEKERAAGGGVLIIDRIGLLSSIYQYGSLAYIGGGFGVGIHNTLEAAAFNLPVIFGPNYQRFREARDLLDAGAALSVSNKKELQEAFQRLGLAGQCSTLGQKAGNYVKTHVGATNVIMQYMLSQRIT